MTNVAVLYISPIICTWWFFSLTSPWLMHSASTQSLSNTSRTAVRRRWRSAWARLRVTGIIVPFTTIFTGSDGSPQT
ncbi:uncharacterized protein B0I36DRAFT_334109 [Microdochium trichocladiopsis]|uniref:Uncharacterized protein n=1 Tax=Microdochium trichocladiopsis TaxID=1682393 RepID=A0A9P8XWL1_9PEZI|nr:uncharacterized protein B0I36DRAFT_334109 [Microdochium trichocladiopsis]KAH7021246.1 hypothetical protein B0I36DRAFT_334109 [Microdochium trichocladiopsis]